MALSAIEIPEPVISVAVEPKTKGDQEKMGIALARLADEDPTFKVRTDEESGQTMISGMGELHLEILVDRMKREHKVEANVGEPQVAFRETIRKSLRREGKYIRQTGGSGNYGHVKIRLEPNEPGKGFEFIDAIRGGVVPKEYIKPIEKGIREALTVAFWPGTRWWTSRPLCMTAATTTWIRTKWPSRLPVRWRSRKRRARPKVPAEKPLKDSKLLVVNRIFFHQNLSTNHARASQRTLLLTATYFGAWPAGLSPRSDRSREKGGARRWKCTRARSCKRRA